MAMPIGRLGAPLSMIILYGTPNRDQDLPGHLIPGCFGYAGDRLST